MDRERIKSMGCERDLSDGRDLTTKAPQVGMVRAQSGLLKAVKKALPPNYATRHSVVTIKRMW
jgi:hypothetical protein